MELNTVIAVGKGKGLQFVNVVATKDWIEKNQLKEDRMTKAIVVNKAYRALELNDLVNGGNATAQQVTLTTKRPDGSSSMIPGMEPLQANSCFICICDDTDCVCTPC